MKKSEFRMIEVGGQPFDMGYQHGSELRDLVALSLEVFRREMTLDPYGVLPAGVTKPSFEDVVDLAAQSISITTEYAPEVVEEMRGIAKGSGFKFEEIFALNSLLDIVERMSSQGREGESAGGCSSYAVNGEATAGGGTYVGWNADYYREWLECAVLIKATPVKGPPVMFWDFAGSTGRPGMNPYLGLSANGLFPSDCSLGVPYCVICRKILQQRSVDDAVAIIAGVDRMAGLNYTLGDVEGNVVAVETTARRSVVIPGVNGKVVHTNIYLADELLPYEMTTEDGAVNSQRRLERLQELLMDKEARSVTLDDLKAVHRDHANRPDSICAGDHRCGAMTLTSLITDLSRSRLLVAYGHPCEHEFVEYAL